MAWWSSQPRLDELLSMDYATFYRMRAARNIYDVVVKFREATDERIHQLTDNERRLLRWLMDNGIPLLG